MKSALYEEFRSFSAIGDRKRAAKSVRSFIDSFEGVNERGIWVREYLEKGDFGHKIRHELYLELVFPELFSGYQRKEPWSLYFLAHTIQNIYGCRELHEELDWETEYSLLKSTFEIEPGYRDVRARLLATTFSRLSYAIHEWPSGLCCEIDDVESDLEFCRVLDTENKYDLGMNEVQAILEQAEERLTSRAS